MDTFDPPYAGGSEIVLAVMFRRILLDLYITRNKLCALETRFIDGTGISNDPELNSRSRVAIREELMGKTMTWKVFVKGMVFLNVRHCVFIVTLYFNSKESITTEIGWNPLKEWKSDSNSVLTELWRMIRSHPVSDTRYEEHVEEFLKTQMISETTLTRAGFERVFRDDVSFKTLYRGLRVLRPERLELGVILTHGNEKTRTQHTQTYQIEDTVLSNPGD